MLHCVGFSLKEDRLQKVRGSGLLSDWDRTDGRTVLTFGRGDPQGPYGPLRELGLPQPPLNSHTRPFQTSRRTEFPVKEEEV